MYDFNVMPDNMNMSRREANELYFNNIMEMYNEDQEKKKQAQAALESQGDEFRTYRSDYLVEEDIDGRHDFLQNVKKAMLSECLFKLYKESSIPLTQTDTIIAKNLVNKFVIENGANELLNSFATKNMLLSEMSRIVNKYYNKVLETCDGDDCENKGDAKEFIFDNTIKDDFYKELSDVDMYDASKLIKMRVSDAIADFVNSNMDQKLEYEDIIKSAQDQIAKNEAYADEISNMAQLTIEEMKESREKNMFHYMVESLSKKSLTDNSIGIRYLNESALDMEKIVNDTRMIYTMLEMVNTTEMTNVTEEYMNEYIKSLQ